MTSGLMVLDTHVWVWLVRGAARLQGAPALAALRDASREDRLALPAICLWEVAMLQSKGRVDLDAPPLVWLRRALAAANADVLPLTPEIAVESAHLPALAHKDPADRLIVATARVHGGCLVTADRELIAYGQHGLANVLPV